MYNPSQQPIGGIYARATELWCGERDERKQLSGLKEKQTSLVIGHPSISKFDHAIFKSMVLIIPDETIFNTIRVSACFTATWNDNPCLPCLQWLFEVGVAFLPEYDNALNTTVLLSIDNLWKTWCFINGCFFCSASTFSPAQWRRSQIINNLTSYCGIQFQIT